MNLNAWVLHEFVTVPIFVWINRLCYRWHIYTDIFMSSVKPVLLLLMRVHEIRYRRHRARCPRLSCQLQLADCDDLSMKGTSWFEAWIGEISGRSPRQYNLRCNFGLSFITNGCIHFTPLASNAYVAVLIWGVHMLYRIINGTLGYIANAFYAVLLSNPPKCRTLSQGLQMRRW